MKIATIHIQNYRAIPLLELPISERITVFHGENASGKTSVLSAIAAGLGSIPQLLTAVSGADLQHSDIRGKNTARVRITNHDGISWTRQRSHQGPQQDSTKDLQLFLTKIVDADQQGREPLNLPIVAYYDAERTAFDAPQRSSSNAKGPTRYAALHGALSANTNFRTFLNWFASKDYEEIRLQRDTEPGKQTLTELGAVRRAIKSMLPGASIPRMTSRADHFVVSMKSDSGTTETLNINQMSGGSRIILALTADLARRMAQGNPHLDDPLKSEAIVLVDEVDQHLHPRSQQNVLTNLVNTFPNTQFIVSTNSPQVLTTIQPEAIMQLQRDASGITAKRVAGPTYGAEAGEVLQNVMGVRGRPPNNEFVKLLDQYTQHVSDGTCDSKETIDLRRQLESFSPHDPILEYADIEIRKQQIMNKPKTSTTPRASAG